MSGIKIILVYTIQENKSDVLNCPCEFLKCLCEKNTGLRILSSATSPAGPVTYKTSEASYEFSPNPTFYYTHSSMLLVVVPITLCNSQTGSFQLPWAAKRPASDGPSGPITQQWRGKCEAHVSVTVTVYSQHCTRYGHFRLLKHLYIALAHGTSFMTWKTQNSQWILGILLSQICYVIHFYPVMLRR